MNWTTNLPVKSGFYWWRKNKYKNEGIYCVFHSQNESINKENDKRMMEGRELLSRYDSIEKVAPENRVFYCRWVSSILCDRNRVECVGGEWYGPIQAPE